MDTPIARKHSGARSIRAIIVDDEDLARQLLRELLGSHPEVDIIAECANGFDAVKAVAELNPDVVFLDIQMPKLNGFEVLELLERKPAVVFITAYDEFAVRAFEVHALDYLLKPFSEQRLAAALARVQERGDPQQNASLEDIVIEARAQHLPLERILIRDGSRVHIVAAGTIDFIEAQDDYVCLSFEGKKLLKQQTLSVLATELDSAQFVRIHRSYIVNIERLAKIELYAKDSRVAILKNGMRLPVSRSGYAKLRKFL